MPEGGEDVLCYHCNNVFPKDTFGLMCPRCGSDFTEIIEGSAEEHNQAEEHDSRSTSQSQPSQPDQSVPQNPFFNHNPWAETNNDEPQRFGASPRISRQSYRSPDGRITFTSTTFTTGMGGRVGSPSSPDAQGADPLFRAVGSIFQGLAGAYNTQNRNGPPPDREDPWETPGATRGANFPGGLWPRDTDNPQPPVVPLASLDDIFDLLSTDRAGDGFDRPRGGIRIMGTTGMSPMHPLSILAAMLGGGRVGDAVYSQEELDRVISQLVDQNMNQGAPPATETAIHSLPKKTVDQEMLGPEGTAECSICMDPVELGSQVTLLPCKHWFHGDCIEIWLKQHNTCPHCRRPIDQGENAAATSNNPAGPNSPQSPLRQFSASGHGSDGDAASPEFAHSHPFDSHSSFNMDSHQTSSDHTTSANTEERQEQSGREESENQQQASGGGVTGWLRSHFGGS